MHLCMDSREEADVRPSIMRDIRLFFEDDTTVFESDAYPVASGEFAGENITSERVEYMPLDGSLERPCAEFGVKPDVREVVSCGLVENDVHALVGETG